MWAKKWPGGPTIGGENQSDAVRRRGARPALHKKFARALFVVGECLLGDFGEIAQHIPMADEILANAPQEDGGLIGKLGELVSSLRGEGEGLGDLAELASGFKSLGLDADLLKKFVPIVLEFLKKQGGDSAKALLDGMD